MTEPSGPDYTRMAFVALVVTSAAVLVAGTIVGAVAPGASLGNGTAQPSAHEDPATVDDGTDLSAVERQMAERLAQRVRSGSVNISQEEAEQVRQQLNNSEYSSLLERYSEVANETGAVNRSRAFQAVRSDQLALVEAMDQYRETYIEYQRVRDGLEIREELSKGRTLSQIAIQEPRAVARELEAQWEAVNESHAELVASQQRLATLTDGNVTAALAPVNESVERINETHQIVRAEQFVATNLTATTDDETASFARPATIRGHLRYENGTAVGNESITLSIGDRSIETRADDAGQFTARYRPTTISRNTTNLTVSYVPANESVFLDSTDDITTNVTQVTPNVTVETSEDRLAYNETVQVSGHVGVDEVGAPNVSYLVLLGDSVVARNETDANGTYRANVTVPADVASGEQSVRVLLPLDGQALAATNGTENVTVVESPTALTATVAHVEGQTIRVHGNLTLADGGAIPDERVTVTANGTILGTARTGPNGAFTTSFVVPESVSSAGLLASSSTVGIEVRYDSGSTNLGGATTESAVSLPATPIGLWIGGAVLALVALGGAFAAGRRYIDWDRSGTAADAPTIEAARRQAAEDSPDETALLSLAREQLSDGQTEAAIAAGYAALRAHFEEQVGRQSASTLWEFYNACADSDVDEDVLSTLRDATEQYERVQFTDRSPDQGAVATTLDRIAALTGGSTDRASQGAAD